MMAGVILIVLGATGMGTAVKFIPRPVVVGLTNGIAVLIVSTQIPDDVSVFRIHGPFLFGATDKISRIVDHIDELAPIVVVRLRNMTAIDATGLHALEDLADGLHRSNRELILCGAPKQPAALMHRAEFHQHIGADNICENIDAALKRAVALHQEMNQGQGIERRRGRDRRASAQGPRG